MQLIVAVKKSTMLKPLTMINIEGVKAKTKGTSAFQSARRNAVLPVRKGSAPAIDAPA
jgi:hypothetical protein